MNNSAFFTIDGQLYLDCYPLYLDWMMPIILQRFLRPLREPLISNDLLSKIFKVEK